MSNATELLAAATAAYKEALDGRVTQFNGRRWEPHDINLLSAEVDKWQRVVDAEQRAARGQAGTRFSQATFND